ncbi:MAG: SdrD B-like domain-containing protein [Anaerolineae bacterium]
MQLWNASKTQLIASTVTSPNGIYTVIAPLPGQYRIRVLLANDVQSFSPKDQAGGDNILDSDINPAGTNQGFTDVIDIASNVISMTSIDAGVIAPLVFQQPVLQQLPIITPTNTPFVNLAPPVSACTGFRLTSPLDGLPNGVATFYWDPVGVQGALYQIVVMNEGRGVLAVFTAQNATSLSVDVSQGAIGGGFQVIVQINAILNGQVACSDEHTILRAAPDISAPSIRVPQPTPTRPRGG